jgi:hypothetical protein
LPAGALCRRQKFHPDRSISRSTYGIPRCEANPKHLCT